jgi:lipopolysaccharide export system permease protein
MKILHRYLLGQFLRNLFICTVICTSLLTLVDFFDRIDNIAAQDAGLFTALSYFIFKIPSNLHVMLPTAVLVATLFTFGLLSKNSEITAMRAAGVTIFWLIRPILFVGLCLSLIAILFNETIVPYSARRAHEIYNIDIQKKDKAGTYSQQDFWWRSGPFLYTISNFDSRTNTMHDFSQFEIGEDFNVRSRTDAPEVHWLNPELRWSMRNATETIFTNPNSLEKHFIPKLSIPRLEDPEYFYGVALEPEALGFAALRKRIKKLARDGINTEPYRADLHAKLSYPFVNLIVILTCLPFALKPARSGNMASSFIAGVVIGFAYYLVHSLSVSLGRAELLPPVLAAWSANLVLGFVGLVLNWGAEAP